MSVSAVPREGMGEVEAIIPISLKHISPRHLAVQQAGYRTWERHVSGGLQIEWGFIFQGSWPAGDVVRAPVVISV